MSCNITTATVDGCWISLVSVTRSSISATGAALGANAFVVLAESPGVTFGNTTEYTRGFSSPEGTTVSVAGSYLPRSSAEGDITFYSFCKYYGASADISQNSLTSSYSTTFTSSALLSRKIDLSSQVRPTGCVSTDR